MAFIKINRQNFHYNLNQIALQTGSIEKIAIVLKDNAYGHGLVMMAKMAASFGIKEAVVRNSYEAEQIASYFQSILILGDTIQKHSKFRYVLNSLEQIKMAPKGATVELKVDTGMHRNGIDIKELDDALKSIVKQELNLVGVMTHYRSADVLSSEFFWQQKNFEMVKNVVRQMGFDTVRFHSHNSASILRTKNFDEDMVRVGIGAYGYNELDDSFTKIRLKPVLSLFAKKVSTRVLKEGERVGYGGDFMASKEMIISTYDLGYGDGWFRGVYLQDAFNTAEDLPIIGRVSMDFISLESKKEEVCIFTDAQLAAKQLKTISYEILTALHANIKREVIDA